MDRGTENTYGQTRLVFPQHGGAGAGFASPHVDREKVTEEAIIRELIQNALDAATGRAPLQVIFCQEKIPTDEVPCKSDYERTFKAACSYRQTHGRVDSPTERQAIDRISSCLQATKVSVLVCTDFGKGIGEQDLRSLYNTGDTTKRIGRGSVGLGHLTAFAASDLRYVLYAGRQQSGRITFGGHAILATSRSESEVRLQHDAHGYIRGEQESIDTPASEASGAHHAPILVDRWLPENNVSGSAVAILGYASDELGDLRDNILVAAAKNFIVAVHLNALTVAVRTHNRQEILLESGNLGSVLASKKEQQRVRRSLGVRGREAWSAYQTLTSDLPILDDSLPGVTIWFRQLLSGDRTLVCFFREGMWITSHAKHLQKADFDDRVPFCAVVNVEHVEDENGESVCSLVREAEGETHSQIRPTEITDIGMRCRLDEALERIREILRHHAPERRAENIEPEQLRFFHGKTLTLIPRPPRRVVISNESEEDVIEEATGGDEEGGRGSGGRGRGRGGGEDDGRRRSPKKVIAHGNTTGIRTASRHLRDRCWAVAWDSNRFHTGGAVVRVVVPSGSDETTDRYVSDEYLPISALRMNGETLIPHDADSLEIFLTNPPTIGEAEIELANEPHEQDIAVLRIQVIHRHESVGEAPA